jgi:PPE-repeat protein
MHTHPKPNRSEKAAAIWRWLSNFTASAAGRLAAALLEAIFTEDP